MCGPARWLLCHFLQHYESDLIPDWNWQIWKWTNGCIISFNIQDWDGWRAHWWRCWGSRGTRERGFWRWGWSRGGRRRQRQTKNKEGMLMKKWWLRLCVSVIINSFYGGLKSHWVIKICGLFYSNRRLWKYVWSKMYIFQKLYNCVMCRLRRLCGTGNWWMISSPSGRGLLRRLRKMSTRLSTRPSQR